VTEPLFESPGDLLLARGTEDPVESLALSRAEEDQLRLIRDQSLTVKTLVEVGLVLGAAFLLYRSVVERKSRAELDGSPDGRFLRWLALRHAQNFIPGWLYMVTPAIEYAYTLGTVRDRQVPDEWLTQFAERYAGDIANYFNQTSADALSEGFNGFVNKKLPRRLAAERALDGWGLNNRMMRAVLSRVGPNKIDSVVQLDRDASTRDWIESMLVQRAHTIGENEGFNVTQHGRQLSWMYQVRTGRLPANARKVWLTARDERVCASCGPMHKREVRVSEAFETEYGKLWVPSMHPSCRCEVVLRIPTEVGLSKALGHNELAEFNEEHPRGEGGRFRTKLKERPQNETLERLLSGVQQAPAQEVTLDAPEGVSLGASEVGLGSSGTSLGQTAVSLGKPDAFLGTRSEVSLGSAGVSLDQDGASLNEAPVVLQSPELVELHEDLKLRARQATDVVLDAPRTPLPRRESRATVVLEEPIYFLDPAGFHHFEDMSPVIDHMDPEKAKFEPWQEFATIDATSDIVETMFQREIQREARRIMQEGRNIIGSPYGDRTALTEEMVTLAIEAEITGAIDQPGLREYAQHMGIRRHEWTLVAYRMEEAYMDSFEGITTAHGHQEFFSAPGEYWVDEVEESYLGNEGYPVVVHEVLPILPEDEEDPDGWARGMHR